MKIIHIFTGMNYVYTFALINMFKKCSDTYQQEYLICDFKSNSSEFTLNKDYSFVKYTETNNLFNQACQIIQAIERSDFVIFHFLPNNIFLHISLLLKPLLLKKVVWRIWGADLYNWKKSGLKGILFNSIRNKIRERIRYVISYPMDRAYYRNVFGSSSIFLNGPYPMGYSVGDLDNKKCKKDTNSTVILLGHSAVKTLHHKYILDLMSKYKDEDIKILIPLNYGDQSYAEEVYEYACKIFSEKKIEKLTSRLSLEDYISLLWKCDVSIVYSDRQIAMGNLTMLMYMKKKIYLKRESVMDRFYRKEMHLDIYDADSIQQMSFSEFIYYDPSDTNMIFAENELDSENMYREWENSFKQLFNKNHDNCFHINN